MTEVIVTDYETMEMQKTKYQCDHCGVRCDEGESNTANIYEGPSVAANGIDAKRHLCEDCLNVREALQIREERATIQDRWESFAETLNPLTSVLWVAGAFFCGVGTIWFAGGARLESQLGIVVQEVVFSSIIFASVVIGYTILCVVVFTDVTE